MAATQQVPQSQQHDPGAIIETKVNFPLVGAFVLLLGSLFVVGVLWLASGGAWQKKYDLYLAIENESVAGLNQDAPVKFNGVTVGKVADVRLDPVNPERVRLLFAIERGTPIKEDTVAVLKTQGLTGIAYVELSGGAPGSARLRASGQEPHPVIRTKPSLAARLENVLTTVLSKLDRTTGNIDAILSSENRAALTNALTDIAALSRTLASRKDTLDRGITDAASTLSHTARVTAQLGPVVERIARSAEAVEKMGDGVALAGLDTAKSVESVGTDLKRFTAETLPELERLISELNLLSTSLHRLSEQTQREPSSLLFGRGELPEGPGESPADRVQR